MNPLDAPEDAAVARTPELDDALFAIEHWVSRPKLDINFQSYQEMWRGTPVLLRYLSGRCVEASQSEELRQAVHNACEYFRNASSDKVNERCSHFGVAKGWKETQALARAFCHIARAVVGNGDQEPGLHAWLKTSRPQDFTAAFADLQVVFDSYHAAWNLPGEPVTVQNRERLATPSNDTATAILDEFQQTLIADPKLNWFTRPNWLIVRRLLSYLLTPKSSPKTLGKTNRMHLLAASPTDDEGVEEGRVLTATTQALNEGQDALYLDPVTSGLMGIDDDLRTGLAISGQTISPELKHFDPTGKAGLRISWDESTVLPDQLNGDSGGGLLVVSAVASSRNIGLDAGATASFAFHLKSSRQTTQPRLDDYCIAPVGGIRAKLTNNRQLGSIQRVYLCAGQTLDPHGTAWDDWVPTIASKTRLTILPVGTGDPLSDDIRTTLDKLIHDMTGDHQIELVLDAYCDHLHGRWARAKPKAFVEFRFGRLPDKDDPTDTDERLAGRVGDKKTDGTSLYKPVTDKKDATAEDHLRELLALGRKVCLTEDAGAGKTIASHRLLHYLTDRTRLNGENLRSPLVARFESREHNWPNDVRQTLIDDIALSGVVPSVNDSDRNWIAKVVDYAIRNKRLTLIFDAFDQVYDGPRADRNRSELLQSIWAFCQTNDCQVIVTSRAFAVRPETSTTFFPRDEWKFATIFGFHEAEQTDYLRQAGKLNANQQVAHLFAPVDGGRSENLYQRDPEIRRLLSVPNNLNLLRDLSDEEIRKIRNRFDLYQKFHNQQLNRATRDGSQLDSKKCHVMLAAAGFQMMLDGCWHYSLLDDEAQTLELRVDERCRQLGYPTTTADWDNLKKWSELTNHGILDDIATRGTRLSISWKHRGWMEFFAARFLTLFASPEEAEEALPSNGERNWYWTWRFVLEAPLNECTTDRWQRAVTPLFQPVPDQFATVKNPQTGRPERMLKVRPRPTELIFRAWQTLQRGIEASDKMWPIRDSLLARYRQQFLDILAGTDKDRAQRAAEVITERDLWEHVRARRTGTFSFRDLRPDYVEELAPLLGKQNAAEVTDADIEEWFERKGDQLPPHLRPAHSAYALCSNATSSSPWAKPSVDKDYLTFLMGASPEDTSAYDDEKYDASDNKRWWNEQSIPAFRMATCCVTRAQYRLFDPHREQDKLLGDYGINKRAPDEDCPITHVDWWDAFCFGLWLGEGYQLPTEVQWEGAAWGGIDREKHRGAVVSVPPYHAGFTPNEVNHNGKHPIEGQTKSDYAQRTLPVRWDDQRRRSPLSAPQPERMPSAYKANGFGLWHVNGNVYEWCESGWADTLKGAIVGDGQDVAGEDVTAGTGRVVRGGSWDGFAWSTRSSNRDWIFAEDRYGVLGFRLSRTF